MFNFFNKIQKQKNDFSISPDQAGILAAKRRDKGASGNCISKNAGTIRSK